MIAQPPMRRKRHKRTYAANSKAFISFGFIGLGWLKKVQCVLCESVDHGGD